jgi:hypothetical protein
MIASSKRREPVVASEKSLAVCMPHQQRQCAACVQHALDRELLSLDLRTWLRRCSTEQEGADAPRRLATMVWFPTRGPNSCARFATAAVMARMRLLLALFGSLGLPFAAPSTTSWFEPT